jgi:hypothetical protein
LKKNVLIVGLGPYCLFTHLNILLEMQVIPRVIIELQSKAHSTKIILGTLGLAQVKLIFIPDEDRNSETINLKTEQVLNSLILSENITHAIISTEPKAHFSYLKYFIGKKIASFCDKPIVAIENASIDKQVSTKILSMYTELLSLSEELLVPVYINTKRREHSGYKFIKQLVEETSKLYNLAPTSLEISASDGMWNFPIEFLTRENHPYKYGYGKMMHTGYHFIDLISYLLEDSLRRIHNGIFKLEAQSYCIRPPDNMGLMNEKFYQQFFKDENFKIDIDKAIKVENYGELDIFSIMRILNSANLPLTQVSLNLMNTSFSRRSWQDLPFDTYKGNGRVRHERMSLHVGPLLNIQLQEYGTLEDSSKGGPYPISEILIFRNKALIGGEAFQRIQLADIEVTHSQNNIEEKRALLSFLNLEDSPSKLKAHAWSQELLATFSKSIANKIFNPN